ncbi:MAG: exodeoxyribonuclease VII large subunit [Chromatiales bacterium]|jgi:exodeoxyribonuclease VII large subunit|nr:exodeoxyribonuclease VII large subunit [Chromatiales bacterium]
MLRFEQIRVNYLRHTRPETESLSRLSKPPKPPAEAPDADIFTVSRLNREARRILEAGLPPLWVAGELSNLAQPASGHMYFSLKDEQAQVRCAMFRNTNRRLTFQPEDGDQVLVQARVSIYEPRGSYQLIVEQMEAAGEGVLRRRFEELKKQLNNEGLFDERHKQSLPPVPRCIGIVTSPTGAAVRDILKILARRFPAVPVIIYPTRVQGAAATEEIVSAIAQASTRNEVDVLIVARGGGSLEDLWCFNEEKVARAIYACPLPVVSGVGHEVDFTITDLVADLRAPTPSGAAEIVVPDSIELLRNIAGQERRLARLVQRHWADYRDEIGQLNARMRLMHPGTILQQLQQRSDDLVRQMANGTRNYLEFRRLAGAQTLQRLRGTAPVERIRRDLDRTRALRDALGHTLGRRLATLESRVAIAAGNLNAVSPLATLERGYAIVRDVKTGAVLRTTGHVKTGDRIEARLARGSMIASVEKIRKK